MGWRVSDHYDREARERLRALPWRERYAWRRIAMVVAAIAAVVTVWVMAR